MESNFKVKIDVDISDLNNRLKVVEAELKKLGGSIDNASNSLRGMEQNANRGRMVAFAFGQVIRDAGFFSQSFSLGILAISNNIPILIDQLSLSVKALQPFAGALSLIGSLLTAGLTIWAYSTQAVKKYTNAISDAKGQGMASAMELNSLLKVARDESNSLAQRQDAVNRLNERYKEYNNQLTVNNVNSKKNIETSTKITQLMLLEAEAAAIASEAQVRYSKTIALRSLPPEELATFWQNIGYQIKDLLPSLDFSKPFQNTIKVSNLFGSTIGLISQQASKLVLNFSKTNTIVGQIAKNSQLNQLDGELKSLETQSDEVQKKITALLLGGKKGGGKDSILQDLKEALTAISLDPTLSQLDIVKAKIDAYQSALKSLIDTQGGNSKSVKDTTKALSDLSLQYESMTVNTDRLRTAQVKNTMGGAPSAPETLSTEQINRATDAYAKQTSIWNILFGAIKRAKDEQEQFNQSMTRVAEGGIRLIGGELTNAFQVMIETGELSFQSITKALGQMIKRLLAATLAAALLSTIVSSLGLGIGAASKGNFIGNAAEIMRLMGGAMFANGGIVSGPTLGMVGEYPGARSNPEVIAPLDKLKSILGGAGEGQIGAVIAETKISGNDLSILIKRADNNRNEYF